MLRIPQLAWDKMVVVVEALGEYPWVPWSCLGVTSFVILELENSLRSLPFALRGLGLHLVGILRLYSSLVPWQALVYVVSLPRLPALIQYLSVGILVIL